MVVLGVVIDYQLLRLARELAGTGQFENETAVVNAAVREYIQRDTSLCQYLEPPIRAHVVKTVREMKPEIIKLGIVSISLFGSVARGDADAYSAIDFVIDAAPSDDGDTFDSYKVQGLLEDRFVRTVSIGTRDKMKGWGRFDAKDEAEVVKIF